MFEAEGGVIETNKNKNKSIILFSLCGRVEDDERAVRDDYERLQGPKKGQLSVEEKYTDVRNPGGKTTRLEPARNQH